MIYRGNNMMVECSVCKQQRFKKDLFIDNEKSKETLVYICKEPCEKSVCVYCGVGNLPRIGDSGWTLCETCHTKFQEENNITFSLQELGIWSKGPPICFIKGFSYEKNALGNFVKRDEIQHCIGCGEDGISRFGDPERILCDSCYYHQRKNSCGGGRPGD